MSDEGEKEKKRGAIEEAELRRIASIAAPRLRAMNPRKAKVYRGVLANVVGEILTTELAIKQCALAEVELQRDDNPHPISTCSLCDRKFLTEKRADGKPARLCPRCRQHDRVCAGWDGPCPTQAVGPRHNNAECRVLKRGGRPYRCISCSNRAWNASLTTEKRSEAARNGQASKTPEQRSAAARKANASKTPEQRREAARKAYASQIAASTPEQRSEAARKREGAKTPEQRSEAARKANAALTPEQRSAAARKRGSARKARK
jgi:hypothetical protein